MKTQIVQKSWLIEAGHRLDCSPFMSGAMEAKHTLKSIKNVDELSTLTTSPKLGVYHAGRYKRVWVDDPKLGVSFMSSTNVLNSDLAGFTFISKKSLEENPLLGIKENQILITRSGTIGRMRFSRKDMVGMALTEHVLRVDIDPKKAPEGYVYAFLASKFGVPMVIAPTYGAIIQHIEPQHIFTLPVPRFNASDESKIDKKIKQSTEMMEVYQEKLNEASSLILKSSDLSNYCSFDWHQSGKDTGFTIKKFNDSLSLRALNYNERFNGLVNRLKQNHFKILSEIVENGELRTGVRFKRIDASEEFGVKLVGQKQAFWQRPEGRYVSPAFTPPGVIVPDGTLLISAQGTLGERSIFCKPVLVKGKWAEYAYTQHFLRVRSGLDNIPNEYLYAFFRTEVAYRCLWSMSMGSAQQDINLKMLRKLPIPILEQNEIDKVVALVNEAFDLREKADELELSAIKEIEDLIEQVSGTH